MARSRNIKPAFFDNDKLADIEPLGRLLFIGLWTIADYKGELEWRGKRIKAQILPYDDCNIEDLAINLDKSGFIRFYSCDDKTYVNIVNFSKHQNPHKNEKLKGSNIPEFKESISQVVDFIDITINHDKSRLNHDGNEANPADSLNLIPDSLNLIPEVVPKGTCQNSEEFLPAKQEKVPIQKIVELYCDTFPELPHPKEITEARRKALKARHFGNCKGDIEKWGKYFRYIKTNCTWMLTGDFNINFDYLIKSSNFTQIIEGAKDDKEKGVKR